MEAVTGSSESFDSIVTNLTKIMDTIDDQIPLLPTAEPRTALAVRPMSYSDFHPVPDPHRSAHIRGLSSAASRL
ncbi:unnamed protein product [Zymoseptoria tritici ST99CH_1A5]|uniref:Uncharacterized protein n=1 Tax=Zymoseptoria tritici ST99CH_1A5 TaxID=1276529 RepID=A0A1Y6LCU4_ZYMTR|nr:unnamed protein product [Zymoseptoria tritici ST99CH_1A5]